MTIKKLISGLLAVGMLTSLIPTALMEQDEPAPEAQTVVTANAPEAEAEADPAEEEAASGAVENAVPEAGEQSLGGEDEGETAISTEAPRTDEADGEALPGEEGEPLPAEDGEALPGEDGEPLPAEENASARADFEIDDKGVVTRYVGAGGEVIVPDDVTGIGDNAFANNYNVESVTLPKGVTSIGAHAFSSCGNLYKVDLPDTLTSIGAYAFANCGDLSLQLPASLTTIGEKAFTGINSLGNVVIPATMTTVTSYAFAGSYIDSLTISEGVTTIAPHAFEESSGAYALSLPATVTQIGDYAFRGAWINNLTLTEGLKEIGAHAFESNAHAMNVRLPASLTAIGDYAFYNTRVNTLEIKEGLKTIGAHAFHGESVRNLYQVELPKGIESIGDSAFENCGLAILKIDGNVGKMGKRAFADNWELRNVDLAPEFNAMSNGMFADCTSLTSITLPMSLTSVPEAAFSGCTSLGWVEFKGGVAEIGSEAFRGCTALTNVNLPRGLKTIGEAAFSGCASLEEISLPENVTAIGANAFKDCANMGRFVFNTRVSSIGAMAFDGCATLTSVDLPESLTVVGKQAFENCTGLGSFTLTNKTTEIGERAFYGCVNLGEVLIPATVKKIGDKAFDNDKNLTILCENDSVAEKYARDNGIPYKTAGVEQQITLVLKYGRNPVKEYDGTVKVEMKPEDFDFEGDGISYTDRQKFKINSVTAEFEKADVGVQKVKATLDVTIPTGKTTVYKLKDNTLSFEGSITQKTVTVTPDKDQGKGLNAADPELTYTCTGLIGDDKLTGKLGRESGEKAGTYKYTVGTLSHANYKPEIAGDAVFTIREMDFAVEVKDVNYTGAAVTPAVTVTDTASKKVLTLNTDYTLAYSDNTNVGTGKVVVTGINSYQGLSKTATFRIVRGFIVESISAQAYKNGAPVEPAVVVRDASTRTVLTKGTDYSVTYSNNTAVGVATAYVKGLNTYAGSGANVTFRISKPFTATLTQTVYTYTGYAITPRPVVKDGAITLTTAQYTLTYANNTAAGLATVTVTGAKGTDYEGYTRPLSFTIESSDIPTPAPSMDEVELDKNKKVTMYVDDVFDITIPDYDATKFKSGKSSVASVDDSGTVTCLKEGKAKITVTLENKKKRTLTVTVEDPNKVTKMYFEDKSTLTLDVGDEDSDILAENLVLEPLTAEPELEWKSSDKKVVEVDKETGTLTPKKEGKSTITVTDKKSKKSAKIKVKVTNLSAPKRLYFDESTVEVDVSEGTYELTVLAETEGGEEAVTEYKWSSSKSSVAAVDKEETSDTVSIELKKKGSAKISVKSDNGKKASIKIKVTDDSGD